jgi:release factor glutamine methyltransferase
VPGGWLLCEHGYDQGAVCVSLWGAAGFHDVKDHLDLAGIGRVCAGRTGQ